MRFQNRWSSNSLYKTLVNIVKPKFSCQGAVMKATSLSVLNLIAVVEGKCC